MRLIPLIVLGGFALRTVLARQAEKIRRGGDKGGGSAPRVCKRADVAQLVEHSLGKGEVTSSILVISSRNSASAVSFQLSACAVVGRANVACGGKRTAEADG